MSLPCCDEPTLGHVERQWPVASAVHAKVTARRVKKPSSACSPCRQPMEQKSHLAEPCPDCKIMRNNQWLLFKLLSLRGHLLPGIDNWDIFIYTFLHNLCSSEKEKESSRLFRAHGHLAPMDVSRCFYHLTHFSFSRVCRIYSHFYDFAHVINSARRLSCTTPFSIEPPPPCWTVPSSRSSTRMTFTPKWCLSYELILVTQFIRKLLLPRIYDF